MLIYRCDVCGKEILPKNIKYVFIKPCDGFLNSEAISKDVCDDCINSIFKVGEKNISGKEKTK